MKITIHQPEHLPWLGFFNKCCKSDVLVYLDNVQFSKNGFQNRNKILINGEGKWVTVPVNIKGHTGKQIKDIEISTNVNWKDKYLKQIQFSYSKHPFFKTYYPEFEFIINSNYSQISDLNIRIIEFFLEVLNIKVKTTKASLLELPTTDASHNLLNITEKLQGDEYISGPSGRVYLNEDLFKEKGINVTYNDFVHPIYAQKGSSEFISHLSVLDALFNHGPEETFRIINNK